LRIAPMFVLIAAACVTPSCGRSDPRQPQVQTGPSASQQREDEFRWKERCAVAAERLDRLFAQQSRPGVQFPGETSVSEAFYSPSRNSCVCEVSTIDGKSGAKNLVTLYDCLTREDLGSTLFGFNAADWPTVHQEWERTKNALKGPLPGPQK
jgi:hypothetical protein